MVKPLINLEVKNSVALLTFDDPPGNEMSLDFFEQLTKLRHEKLSKLDVNGMVVSGSGRHFSSGANVESLVESLQDKKQDHLIANNHENFAWFENAPFPVVAAISGVCLGSGLELALACHYRIATSRAVFAFPEVEFGLIPGCGGTVRLPRLISKAASIELLITGRSVLADEAFEMGLVDTIASKKSLMETAHKSITRLQNIH